MESILSRNGSVREERPAKAGVGWLLLELANACASDDFSNLKTGFLEPLKVGLD
mgnify:FL=1